MRNTTRGLLLVALIVVGIPGLILFLLHWWMGPIFYSAEAIHARVVDETTGKPIAGAIVVAEWQEQLFGGSRVGALHWAETATDVRGEFTIPAWGPRLRMSGTKFTYSDPEITVYKPGYQLGGGNNSPAYVNIMTRPGESHRESKLPDGRIIHPGYGGYSPRLSKRFSYWNGRDIALRPAHRSERREAGSRIVLNHDRLIRRAVAVSTSGETHSGIGSTTRARQAAIGSKMKKALTVTLTLLVAIHAAGYEIPVHEKMTDTAHYLLTRVQGVETHGDHVYFAHGSNGLWKVVQF